MFPLSSTEECTSTIQQQEAAATSPKKLSYALCNDEREPCYFLMAPCVLEPEAYSFPQWSDSNELMAEAMLTPDCQKDLCNSILKDEESKGVRHVSCKLPDQNFDHAPTKRQRTVSNINPAAVVTASEIVRGASVPSDDRRDCLSAILSSNHLTPSYFLLLIVSC